MAAARGEAASTLPPAALERMPEFTTIRPVVRRHLRVMEGSRVKSISGAPWLLILTLVASVAAVTWFARSRINTWTHQRLTQQRLQELASLPEPSAAQLVRRLSQDDQWL